MGWGPESSGDVEGYGFVDGRFAAAADRGEGSVSSPPEEARRPRSAGCCRGRTISAYARRLDPFAGFARCLVHEALGQERARIADDRALKHP